MGFLFGQPAIETKPKPKPIPKQKSYQTWLALAPHIRKHFDTGKKTDDDIAFELYYADYLQSIKKKDK